MLAYSGLCHFFSIFPWWFQLVIYAWLVVLLLIWQPWRRW